MGMPHDWHSIIVVNYQPTASAKGLIYHVRNHDVVAADIAMQPAFATYISVS